MTKTVICVDSRHLRNLRSDNPIPHKKRANTEVRPYTAHRTLFADGLPHCIPPFEGGGGGMFFCVWIPCTRHNIIQLLMVNC